MIVLRGLFLLGVPRLGVGCGAEEVIQHVEGGCHGCGALCRAGRGGHVASSKPCHGDEGSAEDTGASSKSCHGDDTFNTGANGDAARFEFPMWIPC